VPRVTVSRTLPTDLGMRHVDVFLDSVRVGTLNNSQSLTREIPPGRHVLKVHNTLVGKTAEFDAGEDQHVRFAVANRRGFGSFLIVLFGAGPMYIDLLRVPESGDRAD
jgi:hypothetical protein